jgi:hypothetical protein
VRRARPWLAAAGSYLALTVGLPWCNGAGANPGFAQHVLWVIGLSSSIGGALLLVTGARMSFRRMTD